MLTKSVIAATAAAALALPTTSPYADASVSAPAHHVRHSIVLRDGPGDVWKNADTPTGWVLVGGVPRADVVSFSAVHGRNNLRLVLTFRNLKKVVAAGEASDYYVDIKTPTMERIAEVWTERRIWQGHHYLLNGQGDPARQRGMTHHVGYLTDTVSIVIPRTLLGNPRWVRVGAVNYVYLPGIAEETLEDNPSSHGHLNGLEPPLTVRLHTS
jgi:hypothetical protein